MDSMTLIAMASISRRVSPPASAALGRRWGKEGQFQQHRLHWPSSPIPANTITRTLFVGLAMIESTAIYCFVVSMILIFANPFGTTSSPRPQDNETMLIDWFTVVAQALNFLILVWLLKRFLYKPILNALDAREKRIATELADADARKAEARQEREPSNAKRRIRPAACGTADQRGE